jgi:hypothetical protein
VNGVIPPTNYLVNTFFHILNLFYTPVSVTKKRPQKLLWVAY